MKCLNSRFRGECERMTVNFSFVVSTWFENLFPPVLLLDSSTSLYKLKEIGKIVKLNTNNANLNIFSSEAFVGVAVMVS